MKPSLYEFTLKELQAEVKPSFRAKQIYGWLYHNYVTSYDEMKNLPKTLRDELSERFVIDPLKIVKKEVASDGTIMYVF